jgi:hypothetical protein
MDLIDAYYMVAADIQRHAENAARISEELFQAADRMSEDRARNTPMPATPKEPPSA